jgi:hypothetical protein
MLGTVTIGLKNRQEIALQGRERADATAILKLCDPAHRDAARDELDPTVYNANVCRAMLSHITA